MPQGRVKWFDSKKGFGFITPDAGGEELFLHFSQIEGSGFKTLTDGQAVAYETDRNDKGPFATNIKKI